MTIRELRKKVKENKVKLAELDDEVDRITSEQMKLTNEIISMLIEISFKCKHKNVITKTEEWDEYDEHGVSGYSRTTTTCVKCGKIL